MKRYLNFSLIKKRIINGLKNSNLISLLIAFISVVFLYWQIRQSNKGTQADFAHRLKTDFFSPEERNLMFLICNNLLKFQVAKDTSKNLELPYFLVDTLAMSSIGKGIDGLFLKNKIMYSELEVEDLLLNHFEDLSLYKEKGIIDLDYIYTGFSFYIESTYENRAIQLYIKWIRTSKRDKDSYTGFEELYEDLRKMEKKNQLP